MHVQNTHTHTHRGENVVCSGQREESGEPGLAGGQSTISARVTEGGFGEEEEEAFDLQRR